MCGFVGICGSGKVWDICNNMGLFTSRHMCFPLHSDMGRRGDNMNLPVQLHVKLLQLLIMFASEKDIMDDSVRREWCVCVWGCGVCVGGGVCVCGCVCVWGVCICANVVAQSAVQHMHTCKLAISYVLYCIEVFRHHVFICTCIFVQK